MASALIDGQFPVRIVKDLGYGFGYPIFNFYGPLPYYIGGLIAVTGISALIATKIMMGIGMVLASITMFLVMRSFIGSLPAAVSAIVFMYAPYHAICTRCSL
jgi:uncharacterized membrane protein